MVNLVVAVNADTQDEVYGASAVDWVDMSVANDYFVFSAGSDVVKDGEAVPSESDLIQAGVRIISSKVIVPKHFIADIDVNLLKEIHNAGDNNKRYVYAAVFDGATATEPTLALWDNVAMTTVNYYSLGEGTPSDSWVWGITTTDGLPGAGWIGDSPTVGSRLAGSSDGHFLWLNNGNGALTVAKTLYWNSKIIVPASFEHVGSEQPLYCISYCSN